MGGGICVYHILQAFVLYLLVLLCNLYLLPLQIVKYECNTFSKRRAEHNAKLKHISPKLNADNFNLI